MTIFSLITQRFNDEWRNGSTFATNPTTVYHSELTGNVGDRIKLTQTIEISVTVNPSLVQTMQYNATADATYGEFVGTGINFLAEGLYVGAVVDVDWTSGGGSGGVQSCTVGLITGTGFNTLRLTKANLTTAGITDGAIYTDFRIRLTSVPDTLIYKYGINSNSFTGTNYTSWFDSNEQGYYISNLTGALQDMTRIGLGIKSWDLGSAQAKFDATVGTYFNQYTVEHIFKIPFYIASQLTNLENITSPDLFIGTDSVRYDNGWFFGGTTLTGTIKAEMQGLPGNVGYFNENFNGFTNNYYTQNVVVTNSDSSGVLEGTVANTVTLQVKKTDGNWTAATSRILIRHAKLPTESEYQNKTTTFDTIWIYDQAVQTEGAAPINGTAVITAFSVTINGDPTLLDVSFVITYDAGEQSLISDASKYLLFLTTGAEPAVADDRVSLQIDLDNFSKNLDVTGLINSATVTFEEPWSQFGLSVRMVTMTGWDGDLMSVTCDVLRNTSPTSAISKFQFKILAINSVTGVQFELTDYTVNWPIGKIPTVSVGGTIYQILNIDVPNSFNLPSTELINRIRATSVVPSSPGATQSYSFKCGFQMPWRDWLANSNVPNTLFDSGETQNYQNYKTSNYSNFSNWEIFPIFDITMLTSGGVETVYRKMTAESNIYDFDTNDATFSAVTEYYDQDGNITSNIYVDENVLVLIEITHALGTITLADIEAYIWIERDGSNVRPWFLHSSLDWTSPLNPLAPSDVLNTGNTQFVEVFSANNLIVLRCYTNRDNLQDGVAYNVYGRIKNKTLA
jgi:hypothetical protein